MKKPDERSRFSVYILCCLSLVVFGLLAGCSSSAAPSCGDCSKLDSICGTGVCNETNWECEVEPANEGSDCDDDDSCTLNDVCVTGYCTGTAMDCTAEENECVQGECDRGECEYGPRPDGTACPSMAEECKAGVCLEGECIAENLQDGSACNDGDWCTDPDSCLAGECSGPDRDCSDDFDCTLDVCDSDRNACDHTANDGFCFIGDVCYTEGDLNPDNACQECVWAMNSSDWTNDDTNSCDDGNLCTDPDACSEGVCSGTVLTDCCLEDGDCNDNKDCTSDVCNIADGTCSNAVNDGFCLIGELCVPEGTANPANECQECISATSQTDWSDNAVACDDGLYCTDADQCSGGSCQGTSGVVCDDSVDCTEDICNETGQNCSHPPVAGSCFIGDTCFTNTALNPDNPCQECIAATNQTDWSNDDSNSCDDGNDCTDQDACSAGVCSGTPIPNCCNGPEDCDDNKDCTDDVCEVASGTCSNPILANWCYIEGVCYSDADPNTNNNCQACDLGVANDSWSPANEGAECGDTCQACLAGACANMPDIADADPFNECPACRVCNDSGGCRNATDGDDPKDECDAAECTNDNCTAGSCHMSSGTQCTDNTTTDCDDAQCDGQGVCVQDFAFEASGYSCDDTDACTNPDECDTFGVCAGVLINPEPNAASVVAASSTCLTHSTFATSVIYVELVDSADVPISGATVTITPDTAGLTMLGAVTESAAQPGTYFQTLQAPDFNGDTTFTITAQTGSGACTSSLVAITNSVMVYFEDPIVTGTGSCPIDDNLRVRVVAAESGAALSGAFVMVGSAEATLFETDFDNVLAGSASLPNTGQTDSNGYIEFVDHGAVLDGPQMITAAYGGRNYFTIVDGNASDVVLPLTEIVTRPSMGQITGVLANIGDTSNLEAGLAMTEFDIDSLVKFKFDDLLSAQYDCWRATDSSLLEDQWVEMPSNIFVLDQTEWIIWPILSIHIFQHDFLTKPVPAGSQNHKIIGISGRAPVGDVISALSDGGSLAGIIPLLNLRKIGALTRNIPTGVAGDDIDLTTDLEIDSVDCSIQNKPASLSGSDDVCVTVGDWDNSGGHGRLFMMGFKSLSGGSGQLTTVDDSGDFANIGYLGLGVCAYFEAPVGDEWKSNATSGILDRSGSIDGSGGTLQFSDFLGIAELIRNNRSYSWDSVSTNDTNADYTEHNIDLVETFVRDLPDPCEDQEEDIWRNTYWRILTPAATVDFSLPDIPSGWPLDGSNGLPAPAADEYLNWSFAAYHLGLLAGNFDFDDFDFENALQVVTHSSTNNTDF
ncbi:MAG: hypothetical protein JRJ87_05325 [Deltaproteobacteria bacterium]|nr:hypothetical protein [Deltaproteobacteria bacterium]